MSEQREQIERTADRIRDELRVTLRELDHRRHEATDLKLQLRRHAPLLVTAAAVFIALAAGTAFLVAMRIRNRAAHATKRRIAGLRRAWDYPELIASQAERRPFGVELARRLGMAAAVAAGSQLVRRGAARLLPSEK
jgi:hypothetical protein